MMTDIEALADLTDEVEAAAIEQHKREWEEYDDAVADLAFDKATLRADLAIAKATAKQFANKVAKLRVEIQEYPNGSPFRERRVEDLRGEAVDWQQKADEIEAELHKLGKKTIKQPSGTRP